jgi:hypothetical protein
MPPTVQTALTDESAIDEGPEQKDGDREDDQFFEVPAKDVGEAFRLPGDLIGAKPFYVSLRAPRHEKARGRQCDRERATLEGMDFRHWFDTMHAGGPLGPPHTMNIRNFNEFAPVLVSIG